MQLFCSTGAFVGKVNNRDYNLIIDAVDVLDCDGFEFMIFESWEDKLLDISYIMKDNNINIPVIHADKEMGSAISACSAKSHGVAAKKLELSCRAASIIGAKHVLIHPWGYPDSDRYLSNIIRFLPELSLICESYNIELLIEMVVTNGNDPIFNMKKVLEKLPNIKIAIDSRHLAFHGMLEQLYLENELVNNIEHVHISDYSGAVKDWSKLKHVLHPGTGDINFDDFFRFLKTIGYNKAITLESSSIIADGIDAKRINRSLEYVKQFA